MTLASLKIFSRGSYGESVRISPILRSETVGGALLLVATVVAPARANSPLTNGYFALHDFHIDPKVLQLNLSLGTGADDSLLAVVYFVGGLDVERESVAGDLCNPARAVAPIAGAVGGVIVPALIFVAVNISAGPDILKGWASPTAIAIIAVFYPGELHSQYLALALLPLLAFAVPVLRSAKQGGPDAGRGLAEHFEHRMRPISAGLAVPLFSFFSAGVAVGGLAGLKSIRTDTAGIGIILALVLGEFIGIFCSTWIVAKTTKAKLDDGLAWGDVAGLALLATVVLRLRNRHYRTLAAI